MRPIAPDDFIRIVTLGLWENAPLLPRRDEPQLPSEFGEEQAAFQFDQQRDRVNFTVSRIVRDRVFRRIVLRAYDQRCAITGLKLINGLGRAEVAAAHIRPVERSGPDIVSNGIALSGTAHWMFDRGLISLSDDLQILISQQSESPGRRARVHPPVRARNPPLRASERPHPHFLNWHRENCFKQ